VIGQPFFKKVNGCVRGRDKRLKAYTTNNTTVGVSYEFEMQKVRERLELFREAQGRRLCHVPELQIVSKN
jgi:hypothetical protein